MAAEMIKNSQSTPEQTISVFISYRREDSAGHAGRLFDHIKSHFGRKARIFMDIDAVAPGEDFPKTIEDAIGSCDALIAVIGKQWLTITDSTQHRRLDNQEDFVRLEIATALNRNIPVFPVLVQGATMPRQQDLPDALTGLTRRNALEISDTRWIYDLGRLIQTLDQVLNSRRLEDGKPGKATGLSWLRISAAIIATLILVAIVVWRLIPNVERTNNSKASPATPSASPSTSSTPLPLTPASQIQIVRVANDNKINYGFFTQNDYIVAVTDGLKSSTLISVVWQSGNQEKRRMAEIIRRGIFAPRLTLLKLQGMSIDLPKPPIAGDDTIQPGDSVSLYLGAGNVKPGTVLEVDAQKTFKYDDNSSTVSNLLVTTKIAEAGDSGAPVIDAQGKIVAVVYGGSTTETFCVPIEVIISNFHEAF